MMTEKKTIKMEEEGMPGVTDSIPCSVFPRAVAQPRLAGHDLQQHEAGAVAVEISLKLKYVCEKKVEHLLLVHLTALWHIPSLYLPSFSFSR